jgi:tRNA dimethylallyltransferase
VLALEAARKIGGVEIVAVDSMQVYRGMDIGTAKPSPAERDEIVHHCLDLVEPDDEFTVTEYLRAYHDARAAIDVREHRALLVAGTGLYLRAAVDALRPPGRWPAIRALLEREPDTAQLHARLAALDPVAAASMEPSNRRRVVRALEVCLGSGQPFSSFGPGLGIYPASDVVQIGLRWSRAALSARIGERFETMMADGLLAEVQALAAHPAGLSRTAAQALGYKELLAYFEGRCSLEEAVDLAVTRTRRFAVRQLRWFQRDPRIRWVDMETDGADALVQVVQALS